MDGLNRFTDRECFDIDQWTEDFLSLGPLLDGNLTDMRECDSICFFFRTGAWNPGDTVTLHILQDVGGGGSEKALFDVVGLQPLPNTLYAVEVKAEQLDLQNGFVQARLQVEGTVLNPGDLAAVGRLWGNFHRMPPVCETLGEVFDIDNNVPGGGGGGPI